MLSVLVQSLVKLGTKSLMTMASSAMLEWALFYFFEKYVQSTKTPADDEVFNKFKVMYNQQKGNKND